MSNSNPSAQNNNSAQRSREITLENVQAGLVKIALQFTDEQFGYYKIPLGKTRSIPKEEEFKQMPNLLIPLELKRYTFAKASGGPQQPDEVKKILNDRIYQMHEDYLRAGGFVYVFVNGHLWRELNVLPQGAFRDVNLREFKGEDERPATAQVLRWLSVPYKINEKVQKIEIAYSEVQWSWAYINALGGLAPNDSRRFDNPQPKHDLDRQLPSGVPKPIRSKRLQNITPKLANWKGMDLDTTTAKPNSPEPSNIDWVKLKRADYIYTLYVYDPLGTARSMSHDVNTTVYDMLATKAYARTNPLFTMATLVKQLLAAKPKYKKYVDMSTINDALDWDTYIKILKRIDATTKALGDYLLMPEFSSTEKGMCVATAMNDYWAQTDDRYLEGLGTLGQLLNNMQMNEGLPRLEKLVANNHPLIAPMFQPNSDQLAKLAQNNLAGAAIVLQHLAGAAAINKTISHKVFTYVNLLVVHISKQAYTLKKVTVDLDKLIEQVEKPNVSSPLPWTGEIYQVKAKLTNVKAELWQTVKASEKVETYQTPLGRGVNWLKVNEPLVKLGATGLFAVLEMFNLAETVYQCHHNQAKEINKYVAAAKMIGASLEFYKELKNKNLIELGLSKEELEGIQRETLGHIKLGSFLFNTFGNTIGVVMDSHQSWVAYKQGDESLSILSGISAIGSLDLTFTAAVSDIAELAKLGWTDSITSVRVIGPAAEKIVTSALRLESRSFAIELLGIEAVSLLGILSVIGFAIIVITLILEIIFMKTPLEKWLIHGSFGKDHNQRFLPSKNDGTAEWASWQNPINAENALFTLLYSFIVQTDFHPPDESAKTVIVTVKFPMIIPGKSRFYFELDEKTFGKPDMPYTSAPMTDPANDIKYQLDKDGIPTLHIYHSAKKGQFRFRAFLDVNGDGKLLIPYVFQGNKEMHTPKQVAFHIPLILPPKLRVLNKV